MYHRLQDLQAEGYVNKSWAYDPGGGTFTFTSPIIFYLFIIILFLIFSISTILGTNSLNNADVPLSNKQTFILYISSQNIMCLSRWGRGSTYWKAVLKQSNCHRWYLIPVQTSVVAFEERHRNIELRLPWHYLGTANQPASKLHVLRAVMILS